MILSKFAHVLFKKCIMNVNLIHKALLDAYYLLLQEQESVCLDSLMEEYEQVLSGLKEAIREVEREVTRK